MSRWVEVPDEAPAPPASRWVEVPDPDTKPAAYTEMPPTSPGAEAFTLSPEQQETGEAALRGMAGGASFGMYNRAAGLYDYLKPRTLSDLITDKAPSSYSEAVDRLVKREEELAAKHPWAHGIGSVIGGGATGTGLAKAGLTLVNPAAPYLPRLVAAGTEGAVQGAAQGAGNTYTGNPMDYVYGGVKGGAVGGAVGAGSAVVGSGFGAASNYFRDRYLPYGPGKYVPLPIVRAGRADDEGLRRLSKYGPDAMLPDAGPSMLGVTQGAAQGVGENRSLIAKALTEREQGTIPRLRSDVEAAIGPAPQVSAIEKEIDTGRKLINATEYAPILKGATVPEAEVGAVIKEIKDLGTKARINLDSVAEDLHVPGAKTPTPDTDPQALLSVRQKLDGMIEAASSAVSPDRYRAMILKQARDKVDDLLQTHVPDIKKADAKFAANRKELEALEHGSKIFDKGKNAIDPRDLADEVKAAAQPGPNAPIGPPRAGQRLQQGASADLYRRIGTESDDLRALEKTLGGEKDWAGEKAETVFGKQAAEDIAASLERNRVFRDTYSAVEKGSKTGQMIASRTDSGLKPSEIRGTTLTGLALSGLDKARDAFRLAAVQRQRDEIARLMASRDPAEVARLRDLLIAHNAATIPQSRAINQAVRGGTQGGFNAWLNEPKPKRLEIDTSRWR